MDLNKTNIFNFNGEYELAKYPPKKDGYYMTIRCGLGGIYTNLDKFENGNWLVRILDASAVIAYSKEEIKKEEVEEWVKTKLKSVHHD